jgi:hypothetical protein
MHGAAANNHPLHRQAPQFVSGGDTSACKPGNTAARRRTFGGVA